MASAADQAPAAPVAETTRVWTWSCCPAGSTLKVTSPLRVCSPLVVVGVGGGLGLPRDSGGISASSWGDGNFQFGRDGRGVLAVVVEIAGEPPDELPPPGGRGRGGQGRGGHGCGGLGCGGHGRCHGSQPSVIVSDTGTGAVGSVGIVKAEVTGGAASVPCESIRETLPM